MKSVTVRQLRKVLRNFLCHRTTNDAPRLRQPVQGLQNSPWVRGLARDRRGLAAAYRASTKRRKSSHGLLTTTASIKPICGWAGTVISGTTADAPWQRTSST